jgi:hypothetical protein
MRSGNYLLTALAALVAGAPGTALAYIGPGAGLGAIGTLVALVGALVLAVVGFLWYPVRRILRARKAARPGPGAESRGE